MNTTNYTENVDISCGFRTRNCTGIAGVARLMPIVAQFNATTHQVKTPPQYQILTQNGT